MAGGSSRAGRKPLPTNVHYLHGNPGHRDRNQDEPRYEDKAPVCPKFLGPLARAEWHWLIPKLQHAKILAEVDRGVLVSYCMAFETLQQAYGKLQELLRENPNAHLLKTAKGYMRNPYYQIIGQAKREITSAAVELGLSPSARSRIMVRATTPPGVDPNEGDDLF